MGFQPTMWDPLSHHQPMRFKKSQHHNDGLQRFGHHGLRNLQQLGATVVRIRQHTALASCTAIVESRMENADLR